MSGGAEGGLPEGGIPFEAMVESLYDGVYLVDHDRRILYWNQAAQRLTGYTKDEVLGRPCRDNLLCHVNDQGENLCIGRCPLAATLEDGGPREMLVHVHHRDGHRAPVNVRTAPLRDASGRVIAAVEVFNDASDQHALRERVEHLARLAYLDELTQLPNRRFADARLQSSLHELERYEWPFGLVLFNIDHFKRINDTYGHHVGDEVLTMVAKTLAAAVRAEDLVARWGGEEFVAIVKGGDSQTLEVSANRCRVLVSRSHLPSPCGDEISVTVSGGACMANPEDTAEALIGRADALLYRSKETGRDRVSIG